jgi:hypothetical protein
MAALFHSLHDSNAHQLLRSVFLNDWVRQSLSNTHHWDILLRITSEQRRLNSVFRFCERDQLGTVVLRVCSILWALDGLHYVQ